MARASLPRCSTLRRAEPREGPRAHRGPAQEAARRAALRSAVRRPAVRRPAGRAAESTAPARATAAEAGSPRCAWTELGHEVSTPEALGEGLERQPHRRAAAAARSASHVELRPRARREALPSSTRGARPRPWRTIMPARRLAPKRDRQPRAGIARHEVGSRDGRSNERAKSNGSNRTTRIARLECDSIRRKPVRPRRRRAARRAASASRALRAAARALGSRRASDRGRRASSRPRRPAADGAPR